MVQRSLRVEMLESRDVPAVFTVTSLADSGAGTLRDAVQQSNTLAGADQIDFTTGLAGTITLTAGEMQISDDLTIAGPGAASITVSGNNLSRIFQITPPSNRRTTVSIGGLTLTNGNGAATAVGLDSGGAILITGATTVTIHDAIISNSVGSAGGAIRGSGIDQDLVVRNTQILNNRATGTLTNGGGIDVFGRDFQLINSTVDGNFSADSGGGVNIGSDTGQVVGSTISNNIAAGGGGGGISGGLTNSILIINSTIAGNQANGGFNGGGILAFNKMAIYNSTIVRNTENVTGGAGGVSSFLGSDVTLISTLIAENTALSSSGLVASDFQGDAKSGGNNFIGDSQGSGIAFLATDIFDQPSTLPPLANNGGPTKTILPNGGSFANGNGSNPLGLTTDQRGLGFPRDNGKVDIGAVTGNLAKTTPTTTPGKNGGSLGSLQTLGVDQKTINFIQSLYLSILGRDVDNDGFLGYSLMLRLGESREAVARSIWESSEHRSLQVEGYYRTFLNREGTKSEVDGWVGAMLNGASEEDVIEGFLTSDEYRSRNPSQDPYVRQLYVDILGREATDSEVASYLNSDSKTSIARSILTSPEARGLQLTSLYQQMLLRDASAEEIATYRDRFGSDGFIETVGIEIGASDEFFALQRVTFS